MVPLRSLGTPRHQNAVHSSQARAKTPSAGQQHSQTLPAAGLLTPPSPCPPVRPYAISPHLAVKHIPSSSCSGTATSAVLHSCKVEPPHHPPVPARGTWLQAGRAWLLRAGTAVALLAKPTGRQGWGSQIAPPSEPSLITSPADLLSLTPVP